VSRHFRDAPSGLSARARRFVAVHGVWLDVPSLNDWRGQWEATGVPSTVVDQAEEYQTRWGGLVLPPSLGYDGGPRMLCVERQIVRTTFPSPGGGSRRDRSGQRFHMPI
jgi:hypothetical protein